MHVSLHHTNEKRRVSTSYKIKEANIVVVGTERYVSRGLHHKKQRRQEDDQ